MLIELRKQGGKTNLGKMFEKILWGNEHEKRLKGELE
jgi:hypothetical protein